MGTASGIWTKVRNEWDGRPVATTASFATLSATLIGASGFAMVRIAPSPSEREYLLTVASTILGIIVQAWLTLRMIRKATDTARQASAGSAAATAGLVGVVIWGALAAGQLGAIESARRSAVVLSLLQYVDFRDLEGLKLTDERIASVEKRLSERAIGDNSERSATRAESIREKSISAAKERLQVVPIALGWAWAIVASYVVASLTSAGVAAYGFELHARACAALAVRRASPEAAAQSNSQLGASA